MEDLSRHPNFEDAQTKLDANSNDSTTLPSVTDDPEESSAKEGAIPSESECDMLQLMNRTLSKDCNITLRSAVLRPECALCDLASEYRPSSTIQRLTSYIWEDECTKEELFWLRLKQKVFLEIDQIVY